MVEKIVSKEGASSLKKKKNHVSTTHKNVWELIGNAVSLDLNSTCDEVTSWFFFFLVIKTRPYRYANDDISFILVRP